MSNHYTYRTEWSAEDGEWVGLVAEFPSLSWLADSPVEAITGITQLVDDVVDDMEESGETPPTPLTERRYSGNISVRTSPDQHRKLVIEAAEQGVSLNQWITQKLASTFHQAAAQADGQERSSSRGRAFCTSGAHWADFSSSDLLHAAGIFSADLDGGVSNTEHSSKALVVPMYSPLHESPLHDLVSGDHEIVNRFGPTRIEVVLFNGDMRALLGMSSGGAVLGWPRSESTSEEDKKRTHRS